MMARIALLLLLAPWLGACNLQTLGSVAGGECKIFERPSYAVLGKRAYDQDWIDSQIEGGVGGCHWQRPAPRPPALDARPGVAAPAKKPGLIRRLRDRVQPPAAWPASAPAAVVPLPQSEPPPPEPPSAPPPPPRSALDELLHPSER
jgi:hypothetical protein